MEEGLGLLKNSGLRRGRIGQLAIIPTVRSSTNWPTDGVLITGRLDLASSCEECSQVIRRDNPNNSSTRKLLEWMTCRQRRQQVTGRPIDRPRSTGGKT